MPLIKYDPDVELQPPPPPTRTESLSSNNKRARIDIPYSRSADDLDIRSTGNETLSVHHQNNIDRPLPPVPSNPLDKIDEPGISDENSGSSDNDDMNDDDDDADDNDTGSSDNDDASETMSTDNHKKGALNKTDEDYAFDPDNTLPPSPTEPFKGNGINAIRSNER